MLNDTRQVITSWLKWLRPGLGVKRWLLLLPLGLFAVVTGVALIVGVRVTDIFDFVATQVADRVQLEIGDPRFSIPVGLTAILVGLAVIMSALIAVNRSIVSVVAPKDMGHLADFIGKKRSLANGPRIVVLGGGTGLSTLLRGLKQYSSNLTAIVTTTDDGGSSGQLQRQLGGMIPPGDIRNCLVALADEEPIMQELFQYRFATRTGEDGLSGHSVGNLFLAAMASVAGDFEAAVQATSKILRISGTVVPSTVEPVSLVGHMVDGSELTGETRIASSPIAIKSISLCPEAPRAVVRALEAVRTAEIIVLGPGSLYTSVIPHLLIPELARAIASSDAPRCYVCNIMTQPGETDGYTASQHITALQGHARQCIGKDAKVVDTIIVNDVLPGKSALGKYKETGAVPVDVDFGPLRQLGIEIIRANVISDTGIIRHDPERLARTIVELTQRGR